ncbi:MAG: flagellar basal body rod protein FlgC [Bdellovibrionales bacterium]|jgi:flagellar basal-body rod protein FlgC
MDFSTGLRVSSSGLTAQRMRMNTIASNIANINTISTPEGGPYRRKDVVFEAIPESRNFGEILTSEPDKNMQRVQVSDVNVDRGAPLLKYEPNSPYADENGYVAYPNINLMEEMTNMIQASRSYEANVSAMGATSDMAMKALEIGR